MLRSTHEILGYAISNNNEDIGKVRDIYFDDQQWVVRYFVVDTGGWLSSRKVLVSPDAITGDPDWMNRAIRVDLTREQVENSPDIDHDEPVSRRLEKELADYYRWNTYWVGWNGTSVSGSPPVEAVPPFEDPRLSAQAREAAEEQNRLRSIREVEGYHIRAIDGEIGHVEDFIVETSDWSMRYLVVDTRNFLPGRKVLTALSWCEHINWESQYVQVELTRDIIKDSPKFDPAQPINREYEVRLYDYYGRPAYWA